ncbi:hypothetical protein SISSUDRAFT_1038039 [Sistotremastrum suecicum HHB10207 ss-3]|uniref:Uncharacterized protein n=1 Tax=Sistotremastrum suecicum HHB10207 ss-3 TaxID=1314776 RepID=A0A165XAM8_9AGAM|nr:hypothetical protein SISSUDRAFT_1038039 [Sistotremastrum suecicum HHB10207 ss-3]
MMREFRGTARYPGTKPEKRDYDAEGEDTLQRSSIISHVKEATDCPRLKRLRKKMFDRFQTDLEERMAAMKSVERLRRSQAEKSLKEVDEDNAYPRRRFLSDTPDSFKGLEMEFGTSMCHWYWRGNPMAFKCGLGALSEPVVAVLEPRVRGENFQGPLVLQFISQSMPSTPQR